MSRIGALLRDSRGSSVAEFAMVLPLTLILMFGVIDAGRYMWACNRAEKAAQMGTRYAVATAMVPSSLAGYDFASTGGLAGGGAIPVGSFGTATCDSTECTCTGTCPTLGYDATAFAEIVTRMRAFMPQLTAANVEVVYRNSGLGFAGDPNGADVRPIVTIRLKNLSFHPTYYPIFRGTVALPEFQSSLTLEDGAGAIAN